jgi:hypothetical protein
LVVSLLTACTSGPRASTGPTRDAADAAPEAPSAAAPDATGADAGAGAGGASGSFELPRQEADPTLTHRLVAGPATLVGNTYDSCNNGNQAGQRDRWCAFSRVGPDQRTELWVLDFTKAVGRNGPVACDGTDADCLLLTRDLWVDFQVWGDFQPVVQRFDGDTFIFHSGPSPEKRDPYDGGIWAWRPGWPQARLLTTHGVSCFGNALSSSVACLANAVIDKDFSDRFATPFYREFDLVGEILSDDAAGATGGLLPTIAHVAHAPDDLEWRVRFSPDGQYLAYSHVPVAGAPGTLEVVQMTEAGGAAPPRPSTILTDASEWEISHDGKSIYFLSGFDPAQGYVPTGALKVADFPGGGHAQELAPVVRSFELVGAFDRIFRPEDRGVVAFTRVVGGLAPILLPRLRGMAAPFALDSSAIDIDVSSDLRHSLYRKPILDNPVAMVAHNDGSGSCMLTMDTKAESFAGEFTASGSAVVWIERLRRGTYSEQGWQASPEDCGSRIQFGDHVLDYQLVGDDFVVFKGSNQTSSTWWLEYARLHGGPGGESLLPRVIKEHPEINVHTFRDAAGTWIVFSVAPQATEPAPGLYVHGPLLP